MRKWLSRYLMPLLIVFCAVLLPAAAALAAKPDLVITGTGVYEDVVIYPGEWSRYTQVVRTYSTNNNFDYHKIWKVKGYDLFVLIGVNNLKSQKYTVTFIAKDGARLSKTIGQLRSQFYYPKFSGEGSAVAPTIGFYRAVLFNPDYQGKPDPADAIWQDRELTEADRDNEESPRLYFGQASGQYSENNQSFFLKNLACIVVGEERPVEETPQDEDPGKDTTPGSDIKPGVVTKPGGTTPGKEETKTTAPGTPSTKTDPERDPDPGAATKDEESKEQLNEDTGNGNEPKTAIDDIDNEDREPDPGADKRPREIRWPWIAAGAILVVGPAVGAYFYTRRRGVQNSDQ